MSDSEALHLGFLNVGISFFSGGHHYFIYGVSVVGWRQYRWFEPRFCGKAWRPADRVRKTGCPGRRDVPGRGRGGPSAGATTRRALADPKASDGRFRYAGLVVSLHDMRNYSLLIVSKGQGDREQAVAQILSSVEFGGGRLD